MAGRAIWGLARRISQTRLDLHAAQRWDRAENGPTLSSGGESCGGLPSAPMSRMEGLSDGRSFREACI